MKGRILDNWYNELSTGMKNQQEKAKFLVAAYIALSEQQRFLWAFVFAMPSDSKENAPVWYIEKVEKLFSLVIDAFEPITQNRKEAEIAAKAMWPSIHGICVLAMSHKLEMVSNEPSKKLAFDLLDVYMAGLKNIDRDPKVFTVITAGTA